MQAAAAVALMPLLIFAAYAAVVTKNGFHCARQPTKIAIPLDDPDPPSNTWFLGLPESPAKRHLDPFIRFCRTHERDQQIDRPHRYTDMQTDHATPSVAIHGRI